MPAYKDRVKDQTTTTGTGTLTIDGVAPTGFRTITSAFTTGSTLRYTVLTTTGSEWEVGEGVWTTSGSTLTRVTVYASSNAGSLVNFSAGTKTVFVGPVAQDFVDVPTLAGANAFTGANSFGNASGQTFLASATTTQDGVVVTGRAGGSSSYRVTLAPTTLSASRSVTLPDAAGTVVLDSATQTLTGKTLTDPAIIGTVLEDVFTITDAVGFEVDPGNGSIQLITLGASRTPKATNFAAGESVTLMVDDGAAYTLTWTDTTWGPSGVIWETNAGVAPTLSTTGYTTIVLWKVSTQVYGARVGDA